MTQVDAETRRGQIGSFLVSLGEVFTTLNRLDGKEDDALGTALKERIRSVLEAESFPDTQDEEFWKYLTDLFKLHQAAIAGVLNSEGQSPTRFLYNKVIEKRRELWGGGPKLGFHSTPDSHVTPSPAVHTPPSAPPSTTPPPAASNRAPVPISSARSVMGPSAEELYEDHEIQRILLDIMEERATLQDLAHAVENYTPPIRYKGAVLKALVLKFKNNEGWAKGAKEAFKDQQAELAEQQRRDKEDADLFASLSTPTASLAVIDATTGSVERPKTGIGGFFLKRWVQTPIRSLPSRVKWWLSGFFLGAILVLAAFGLFLRQTTHVTQVENNVPIKDETVDEMYPWDRTVLPAVAGVGIVVAFGFVGIYCSFVEQRKDSGA